MRFGGFPKVFRSEEEGRGLLVFVGVFWERRGACWVCF